MEFEWDIQKNASNIKKHGISFEEAKEIFSSSIVTWIDDRYDYGEIRKISIGKLSATGIFAVVYTQRNNKRRLISARKANIIERRIYHDYIKAKN